MMADVDVDPVRAGITGVEPTELAAALDTDDNYKILNDGRMLIVVEKEDQAGDTVITLVTTRTVEGLPVADRPVTITGVASGIVRSVITDINPQDYNDTNGRVDVSFDSVTGVRAWAVTY